MKLASPEALLALSVGVALVPLLVSIGTCYLKFSIVLSILRSGFGTQQAPSASMIMALSLVMSLVVMQPVIGGTVEKIKEVRVQQLASQPLGVIISEAQAVLLPWRTFLESHCGQRELQAFRALQASGEAVSATGDDAQTGPDGLPTVLAAFVLSEIKKGFVTAFFLLLPFFVVDLVVSNILVGMGLTMLSPVVVSLPLKILLFVSSDGWLLLAQNLVKSYE